MVVEARKSMLEFLLVNHPLDCPVCDKGGECELQDMTFKYGAAESKAASSRSRTTATEQPVVAGGVLSIRPRCILCYRCVRIATKVWA